MANPEHVEIIKTGQRAIEEYNKKCRNTGETEKDYLDLTHADLEGLQLKNIDFLHHINFSNANLKGASFYKTTISDCIFKNVDFCNVCIDYTHFLGGDFEGVNFERKNLIETKFSYSNIVETNFSLAFIEQVRFIHSRLDKVDFRGADLKDVLFFKSKLTETKMTGCIHNNTIYEETMLKTIECEYFYFPDHKKIDREMQRIQRERHEKKGKGAVGLKLTEEYYIRIPEEGTLSPGEFEDRFKSRPTIEYVFTNGMTALDPAITGLSIDANRDNPEAKLRLLDITSRGGEASVPELIAQGESHTLEFKATLEYGIRKKQKDDNVLKSALIAIAGFLNADGGTLLIGVSDSGQIEGLQKDFSLLSMAERNNDKFELRIRNYLKKRFEPVPFGKVNISFKKQDEKTVCKVDVQKSREPIHLDNEVYIRDGNNTQKLEGRALIDWIRQRN